MQRIQELHNVVIFVYEISIDITDETFKNISSEKIVA